MLGKSRACVPLAFPMFEKSENSKIHRLTPFRFIGGVQKGNGGIEDKLIEGLIESATPEADEKIRRVQRNAIKTAVASGDREAAEHLQDTLSAAEAAMAGDDAPRSWQTDKWRTTKYGGSAHELRLREGGLILQDRNTPIYKVIIKPRETKGYYWISLLCRGQGMTSYAGFDGIFRKEGNRLTGGFPYAEGGGSVVEGSLLIRDDGSIVSDKLTRIQHRPDGGVFTWILTDLEMAPAF